MHTELFVWNTSMLYTAAFQGYITASKDKSKSVPVYTTQVYGSMEVQRDTHLNTVLDGSIQLQVTVILTPANNVATHIDQETRLATELVCRIWGRDKSVSRAGKRTITLTTFRQLGQQVTRVQLFFKVSISQSKSTSTVGKCIYCDGIP